MFFIIIIPPDLYRRRTRLLGSGGPGYSDLVVSRPLLGRAGLCEVEMEGRPSRCGYVIVCRDMLNTSPPSVLRPRPHCVRCHRSSVVAQILLVNLTSKARTSSNVQRVAVRLFGRRGVERGQRTCSQGGCATPPALFFHSGLVVSVPIHDSSVGVHDVATLASRFWSPLPLECGFGTCSQ
jgi:hypothetical protein